MYQGVSCLAKVDVKSSNTLTVSIDFQGFKRNRKALIFGIGKVGRNYIAIKTAGFPQVLHVSTK